jgi:hypothetical protein
VRNVEETSTAAPVLAVLEGGPASLSEALRMQTVSAFAQKIKVPHYGGYEHFERASEVEENASPAHVVFRWTMRTEVAE